MRKSFPSATQVRELDILAEHTIPKEWEDQNGHVNIQYYQTLYEIGGWPMLGRAGVDEAYFEERRLGIFDLEHHVYYLSELHVGERVTIHGRFIASNKKRIHGIVFIINADRDELSCTLEFVAISTNLTTRRTNEFPDDILDGLSKLKDAEKRIQWPAPLCGAMAI
jgi:acyl-CoA thioester hydrolase